jgi:hypothetical protein
LRLGGIDALGPHDRYWLHRALRAKASLRYFS